MNVQQKLSTKQGRKVLVFCLSVTGIGILFITFAVILLFLSRPVDQVLILLDQLSSGLLIWRILLFTLFIGGWNYWAGYYKRWAHLDDEQFRRLLSLRGWIAAWLILFELLVTQNVLGQFIRSVMTLFGS